MLPDAEKSETEPPRSVLRSTLAPAVVSILILAVLLLVTWEFDRAAMKVHRQEARTDAIEAAATIRAQAESALLRRTRVTTAVLTLTAAFPEGTEDEFERHTAAQLENAVGILNVAIFRSDGTTYVYPKNTTASTLVNFIQSSDDNDIRPPTEADRRRGRLIGPIELPDKREGLVHLTPTVSPQVDTQSRSEPTWRTVASLLDKSDLLSEIAAKLPTNYVMAIESSHSTERLLYGDPSVRQSDPVVTGVVVPAGGWRLYLAPKTGWPENAPNQPFRLALGTTSAIFAAAMVFYILRSSIRYQEYSRQLERSHRQAERARVRAEQAEMEMKEQATVLQATNDELERSNVDLQQFAYFVSHDLKAPIHGISSFAQLVRRELPDIAAENAHLFLDQIDKSATRMERLITDLLEYSRVQIRPPAPDEIDLNQVVKDVVTILHSKIEAQDALVEVAPLPRVRGDRSQLAVVFQNLIGNALKYRDANAPIIQITSEETEAEHIVSVQDNGVGIAPCYRDKVFEVFRRLHSEADVPGTGIGLAICRRVMQRHGGRIWIDDRKGPGTTFCFALPTEPKLPKVQGFVT